MTDRERKFLSDVITSVDLILQFTLEVESFIDYQRDLKTKSAVERHLGIIGEAVNKYLKESPENTLEHSIQIISLRNRLIHSYDAIDDSIIWLVIKRYLLPLKLEIEAKMLKP